MTGESGTVVDAWIKRHELIEKYGDASPEAKALRWARKEVNEICEENPEQALRLINKILASTQHEYVLANLAAGPLEILLGHHGKEVIADVERLAKSDPRFRSLLQGVWQNLMDDQTWGRVLKAANG
jgi:hypothetical protein